MYHHTVRERPLSRLRSLLILSLALAAITAPIGLWSAAAEQAPASTGRTPVKIAVALPPQAFVAEELFGAAVAVSVLIPQGMSHESYEPTMRQLRALSSSDAYLSLGHRHFTFESEWLARIMSERASLKTINCAKGVALNAQDIHYWLAPSAMRLMIENVAREVGPLTTLAADQLEERKRALLARVSSLEEELAAKLGPFRGRAFLVFHPSWGYFAEQYGLEQLALENEGKEPGPRHIESIIARARAAKVRVVFIEPGMARQSAEAVAKELGATIEVLDPLAYDWIGNLRQVGEKVAASFR